MVPRCHNTKHVLQNVSIKLTISRKQMQDKTPTHYIGHCNPLMSKKASYNETMWKFPCPYSLYTSYINCIILVQFGYINIVQHQHSPQSNESEQATATTSSKKKLTTVSHCVHSKMCLPFFHDHEVMTMEVPLVSWQVHAAHRSTASMKDD